MLFWSSTSLFPIYFLFHGRKEVKYGFETIWRWVNDRNLTFEFIIWSQGTIYLHWIFSECFYFACFLQKANEQHQKKDFMVLFIILEFDSHSSLLHCLIDEINLNLDFKQHKGELTMTQCFILFLINWCKSTMHFFESYSDFVMDKCLYVAIFSPPETLWMKSEDFGRCWCLTAPVPNYFVIYGQKEISESHRLSKRDEWWTSFFSPEQSRPPTSSSLPLRVGARGWRGGWRGW